VFDASWNKSTSSWGEAASPPPPPRAKIVGRPFNAELDATELNERYRPGPTWTARSRELSRSHLVLGARRMTHVGRVVLVAIHLIDDEPVPLMGRVNECEYEAEGMHRITLDLLPIPDVETIHQWLTARSRSGSRSK
jgi:hypothetical protein